MNPIEKVFGAPRILLPVIHPVGWDQALAAVRGVVGGGVRGVFLIDQGMAEEDVLKLVVAIRKQAPALWIGVNLLRRLPADALVAALDACEGRIDGIWSDDAGIDGPEARRFYDVREKRGWRGLYFGGVRTDAAVRAAPYVDVLCAREPGAVRAAVGDERAVAVASGVNADNVDGYLAHANAFIVGSGVEAAFGVIDPAKVARLQQRIHGAPAPWIPALPIHAETLDGEPKLLTGDWRQDAEYPEPLWAATAAELAQRVSIENGHGLYALQLVRDDDDPRCAQLLALAGAGAARAYRIAVTEAERPIEDGYLRRLRIWPSPHSPMQPADVATVVREFFRAERARVDEIEPWLRARYGDTPPASKLFDWIDYPVFDNGSMYLGFAVLVHGAQVQVWSRAVHAHK